MPPRSVSRPAVSNYSLVTLTDSLGSPPPPLRHLLRYSPASAGATRTTERPPRSCGLVAEVVDKIGDMLVAQLKLPLWLADRRTFIRGARQPRPHAAARHPEPAGHCVDRPRCGEANCRCAGAVELHESTVLSYSEAGVPASECCLPTRSPLCGRRAFATTRPKSASRRRATPVRRPSWPP